MVDIAKQQELALAFKKLHIPGDPIALSNVWDKGTAKIIASLPTTKALATTSYAVAGALGLQDEELTPALNLTIVKAVGEIAAQHNLPLTADVQDGGNVEETIVTAISHGVVGVNLEDLDAQTGRVRNLEDSVARIKLALEVAAKAGVPDFVVNARTDVLGEGASIEDAVQRGKAYLAAGATTAFVWGGAGGRGVSKQEVEILVRELGGRLNVRMLVKDGALTLRELRELGVARVSIGPDLYKIAMAAVKDAAVKLAA